VADEIHRITQETLDKLEAEYKELTTVGRTEIARVIEAARLLGDLSENATTTRPRTHKEKWSRASARIDQVIRNHEIVRRDEGAGTVQYASIVKVVYEGDDQSDFQEFFIGSSRRSPKTFSSPPRRRP